MDEMNCQECEYYNTDLEECLAFVCDGLNCDYTLPCEKL